MAIQAQRNYFQALYQLAAEVNCARTSKNALYLLAEITAKSMGTKGCSLMTLTSDGKRLLHTSAYGLSDRYVGKGPVLAEKSIAQVLEGQPVMVKNAAEDERIQYREEAKQEGIASIFSVPMMVREKIVGVMRVYTAEPRDFTDDDLFFACAAANLGAIALETFKIFKACQESQRECKQKTRWLGRLLLKAVQDYESMYKEFHRS